MGRALFTKAMKAQNYLVSRHGYNVSCKLYYEDKKAIDSVVLFGHGFGGHKDNKAAERFAGRALDKLGTNKEWTDKALKQMVKLNRQKHK